MKWNMTNEKIVGLNETNNMARETFYEVYKESEKRKILVARVPTYIQAKKAKMNVKRARVVSERNNENYKPVAVDMQIVRVKKYCLHDGAKVTETVDVEKKMVDFEHLF